MNIKKTSLLICSAALLAACGGSNSSSNNEPPAGGSSGAPTDNVDNMDNVESGEEVLAKFELSVTNLTHAQPFSPLAAVVADKEWQVFELAEPASVELEQIAEGGDNSHLLDSLSGEEAVLESLSADGALPPGMSTTLEITVPVDELDMAYLSAVTMLVNTNDAITAVRGVALNDIETGTTWRSDARAYDAGTEANTEAAGTIPGPADGGEGFNAARDDTGSIRVHPGVIGVLGGNGSSTLSELHRFDNPVAVFSVTRVE